MNFLEVKSTDKIRIKNPNKRRVSGKNYFGFLARTEVFNHSSTSVFLIQSLLYFWATAPCLHDLGTRDLFWCFCHAASQIRLSCRKAALPPGCHFTGWVLVAFMLPLGEKSGPLQWVSKLSSDIYKQELLLSSARERRQIPGGRRGRLAETRFTLFPCCTCLCQPLR